MISTCDKKYIIHIHTYSYFMYTVYTKRKSNAKSVDKDSPKNQAL